MAETKPFDPDEFLKNTKPFDPDEFLKTVETTRGAKEPERDYPTDFTRIMGNTITLGQLDRARAAGNALMGEKTYGEQLQEELAKTHAAEQNVGPFMRGTAQAVGGLPLGFGVGGLTRRAVGEVSQLPMWGRVAAPIVEGGILGGVHGAGTTYSGIPSDYAKNAGMGTIFGAGMGAVAPAVGAAGGAAYRAAADRGFFGGPTRAVADAAQADAQGLRNVVNTPGAMLPDAGPSVQGLAQGAVVGSGGPGRTALVTNLRDRDATSGQRITNTIDQTVGPAPVPSQIERGIGDQMSAMGNAYRQVFSNARAVDTAPVALWIEGEIGRTAGKAQDALRRARADLDIPTNPGNLDPHPERMHAVRSDLKAILRDPNVDGNTKRVLGEVERRLTQELQAKVPGIRQVDDAYAELGAQQRAAGTGGAGAEIFDTGRGVVQRPVETREIMTEGAQPKGGNIGPSAEPFRLRQAARAELDRIVGTNKNDLLKLENLLGQPQDWNAQKLAIAFGPERAAAIRDLLVRERGFRDTYQKVVEGSQTAQRTASAKSQDAAEGLIPINTTLTGGTLRLGQEALNAARRAGANRSRDQLARTLAERDPATIQTIVDQWLRANPQRNMREELTRRLLDRALVGGGSAVVGDRKEPLKKQSR